MSDRRLRSPTLYPAELRALPVETASKALKNTQSRHDDATTFGDSESASSEVSEACPLNGREVSSAAMAEELAGVLLRWVHIEEAYPDHPPDVAEICREASDLLARAALFGLPLADGWSKRDEAATRIKELAAKAAALDWALRCLLLDPNVNSTGTKPENLERGRAALSGSKGDE
jgi:hypothetical protein